LQPRPAIVRRMATADEALTTGRSLFMAALGRRDVPTACSVYAEDALLLPPSAGRISGRDEIRAFWEAGLTSGIAEVELEVGNIRANGRLACEVGRYMFRIEPADGAPFMERGHYVHIHQRQRDGSWRRAVEIFTPGGAE